MTFPPDYFTSLKDGGILRLAIQLQSGVNVDPTRKSRQQTGPCCARHRSGRIAWGACGAICSFAFYTGKQFSGELPAVVRFGRRARLVEPSDALGDTRLHLWRSRMANLRPILCRL